jgi:hypothetical protein
MAAFEVYQAKYTKLVQNSQPWGNYGLKKHATPLSPGRIEASHLQTKAKRHGYLRERRQSLM